MGRPCLARGQGVAERRTQPLVRGRCEMEPWKGDRNAASERDGSFPKITLVEFDFVFLQQRKELILIGSGIMVLGLIGDVASYIRQI